MKKAITLLLSLACGLAAQAQIIITGVMYDPKGSDAPAVGTSNNGYNYKGGYEYIQFMATEDIDFSVTNYSVVICKNTTAFGAPDPNIAWAAGGDRTYKFNLTSGTATKGTFFYVGGPEKRIAGYLTLSNVYTPTLDMSSLNWIRTIPYSDGSSNTIVFDGFGYSTDGLMPNGSANPLGIGVFAGTNVVGTSQPIDAIFIATANPINATSTTYAGGAYKMPDNDHYESANYFGSSATNKFAFLYQSATGVGLTVDRGNFLKLGGLYNDINNTWTTARSMTYVTLVPTSDAAGAAFATLDMIEGSGATNLVSILPVSLSSFSAKKQNSSVNLQWTTASEKNNSHFNVLRSANGSQFQTLSKVVGNGNTNTTTNYYYTDKQPLAGDNFYQLEQVDFNGQTSLSPIVSVKNNILENNVSVSAREKVLVTINALVAGKAQLQIFDLQGRLRYKVQSLLQQGKNEVDMGGTLQKGVYLLSVQQGNEQISLKFIKD